MRCIFWNALCLAFYCTSLQADQPELLSFQQLVEQSRTYPQDIFRYHQRDVRIRGFLYTTDDSRQILAAEPNIKSCCLTKIASERQILLPKKIQTPHEDNKAVVIQGKLIVNSMKDQKGNQRFVYLFENATLINDSKQRSSIQLLISLSTLFFVIGGVFVGMQRKTSPRPRKN